MPSVFARLVLGAALCLPGAAAVAASGFVWQSEDSLRWHGDGQYLHLATDKRGGIDVLDLTPQTLWGLRKGDVILAADGRPLKNVADLFARLRAHDDSPLPLQVRRDGTEQAVALAATARGQLLHDAAPAPASPAAPTADGGSHASGFAWRSANTLRWRSQGQSLHLSTAKQGGITVVSLDPADLWGLREGDVILRAAGLPVNNVDELFAQLRAQGQQPMPLVVRRNGVEQAVPLAAQARAGLLHDAPPAPPPPPPPPAPTGPGG